MPLSCRSCDQVVFREYRKGGWILTLCLDKTGPLDGTKKFPRCIDLSYDL